MSYHLNNHRYTRVGCPALGCSGRTDDTQRPLAPGQLLRVPEAPLDALRACGDARWCEHCGTVHAGRPRRILGRLGSGLFGQSWHEP